MEKLEVKQLFETDEKTLNKISKWIFDEWMGTEENYTFEETLSFIKFSQQKDRIPAMFGLFLNDEIIGVYGFGLADLTPRPDIYPWLQNVYIDKPFRKKGYGRFMLSSVMENAKKIVKSDEIYLYTKLDGFYEKFGWKQVGIVDTCIKNPRIQKLYMLKLK